MTTDQAIRSQRTWARVAGLMYWVVLLLDLSGIALHSPALGLAGALGTIPLALGLFFAVRPAQPTLAAGALSLRLLEAALGIVSAVAAIAVVRPHLLGTALLHLADWNNATDFAAFVFTIGSTLFFYLFVTSRSIPRILAWWGLFASVVALSACLAHLLHPAFPAMTIYAWIPALIAETSTGLWLLIKSVNVAPRTLRTRP